MLDSAAGPERADGGTLGDGGAACDGDRAEVEERDGVAVRGADRHGPAAARDRPRECHRPGCGRSHGRAGAAGHVDPTVLSGGVRIVAEAEGLQHRPIRGPGPGSGGRRADQGEEDRKQSDRSSHVCLLLSRLETETSVAPGRPVVK